MVVHVERWPQKVPNNLTLLSWRATETLTSLYI